MPEQLQDPFFAEAELYQRRALQTLEYSRIIDINFPPFDIVQDIAALASANDNPSLITDVLRATSYDGSVSLKTLRELDEAGNPHAHSLAMDIIRQRSESDHEYEDRSVTAQHYEYYGAVREALEIVADPEYMRSADFWSVDIESLARSAAIRHASAESSELLDAIEQNVAVYTNWLASQDDDEYYVEKTSMREFRVQTYRDLSAYVQDPTPQNRQVITANGAYVHEAHIEVMRRASSDGTGLPVAQLDILREAILDPAITQPDNNILRDLLTLSLKNKRYDVVHELFVTHPPVRDRHLIKEMGAYEMLLADAVACHDTSRIDELLDPLFGSLPEQVLAARKVIADAAYAGEKYMVAYLGRRLKQASKHIQPWYHYVRRYGGRDHAINEGIVDVAQGEFDNALQRAERPRRRKELLFAHFLPYIIARHGDPGNYLQLIDQKITTPEVYRETYERVGARVPQGQLGLIQNYVKYDIAEPRRAIAETALSERLAVESLAVGQWAQAFELTKRIADDRRRGETLLRFVAATSQAMQPAARRM